MPKTATELAPILTVFETGPGEYALRISDLKWRPLVVEASKLLPDARLLTIVTPTSIKVLRVSGAADAPSRPVANPDGVTAAENAGPPPPADAALDGPAVEDLDAEMQAAIREQEGLAPPGDSPAVSAQAEEVPGPRVVRRQRTNGRAGHPETCGRCRGQGEIRIIEEGGAAGTAKCGVCQGSGVIQRYGARR
jgi:hypothetical protein